MELQYKYISSEHSKEDNIKEYINELPKGSVFYDLGANLGWFSLHAASIGLDVYAFEVDENNFKGLSENVELNPDLHNIKIFNIGIADGKKIVDLRMQSNNIGGHHKTLKLTHFSAPDNIISNEIVRQIEVNSLDNIIEENNIPYPNHLKIDIDGSEHAFLMGSPNVLKQAESMVIELFHGGRYFKESIDILNSYGFKETKRYEIPFHPHIANYVFKKLK